MKYKFVFIILFSLIVTSCKNDSTEPEHNYYKVSGTVISGGIPIVNATISLDKRANLSTQSNSSGYFEISNVPKGNYTLYIDKTNSDGSFLTKNSSVSVNEDLLMQALILPKAVRLFQPTVITESTIEIHWSPTDANDFREYKLYRNTSSGLDENTGRLIHVSTTINDTSFIDEKLPTGTKYYYRVYVMNEYGKLGGSNIISAETENSNIIINGGFEELDQFNYPVGWTINNRDSVVIINPVSNSISYSGNISMRGFTSIISTPIDGFLEQKIPYSKFEPGAEYIFSFWYLVDSSSGSIDIDLTTNKIYGPKIFYYSNWFLTKTDGWVNKTVTFTFPSGNPTDLYFQLYFSKANPPETKLILYLDDFEIKKK